MKELHNRTHAKRRSIFVGRGSAT